MPLRSMTGFGTAAETTADGTRVSVEIRTVNHRHREVRVRPPKGFPELGPVLEARAAGSTGRGRFDVSVAVDAAVSGEKSRISPERVARTWAELQALRDALAPGDPLPFATVFHVPGLFAVEGGDREDPDLRAATERAFDAAMTDLDGMRAREGVNLVRDLRERLALLTTLHGDLARRTATLATEHFERLRGRIAKLLEGTGAPVPAERIAQEAAMLADRGDVAEELTRFASHLQQFDQALANDREPQGKRLDFLLQEFAREVNTTASKAQDSAVAHVVVAMKVEIERLREQVQNLE